MRMPTRRDPTRSGTCAWDSRAPATAALHFIWEQTASFHMTDAVQSLTLLIDKWTGTIIYNSFLSENEKLADRVSNHSVNHLMLAFLLQQEFWPLLWKVLSSFSGSGGGGGGGDVFSPGKLLLFSLSSFLLISFTSNRIRGIFISSSRHLLFHVN